MLIILLRYVAFATSYVSVYVPYDIHTCTIKIMKL